jgi:hypothetical protein
MAKQEKITPQQAVEAVLGLVNMIDTDKLAKLSKLDEIDGLKTGLEEVKTQIKALDATLSQPVKIEDPVLIESGPATRNHCIQFAYIHARNSYKILKRLEEDIPGIKSDIEDIKTQLDEMRKPWWKKILTKKVIPSMKGEHHQQQSCKC